MTMNTNALLSRLLATRPRDEEVLYAVHRELLAEDPVVYRRLLRFLLEQTDAYRHHLVAGLALLSVHEDPALRQLATDAVARLDVALVCDVVDHVRGWVVEKRHAKAGLKRFADTMSRAYESKGREVKAQLSTVGGDPQSGEIVVTLGQYDKVQQVLDYLELPYRLVPCTIVKDLPLRADQVLIVNCPGHFDAEGIAAIERFVRRGGTLVTTDWALKTTVQRAFPDTVRYDGPATEDDVVEVSWIHPDDAHTRGVEVPGHALSWWLEGSSYAIHVVDERRVRVLVRSQEMGRKYQHDPLVVCFPHGEGAVFHLTSHYYLQRSKADASSQDAAAYSSLKLLGNIVYERRRLTGV